MTTFATFADTARIGALLGRYLPEYAGSVRIARCEALRLRYRTVPEEPRRSFLQASYRLHLKDSATGEQREQIVYLKAYRDGRSASKVRSASPCTHLPALDSIVWTFPNDPRMPHLPRVTDSREVHDVLPYGALPVPARAPGHLEHVRVTIVRYKPEHRCTARYDLSWDGGGTTLYGKTYREEIWPDVEARLAAMSGPADPLGFAIAPMAGLSPAVFTVWQQAISGVPLPACLHRPSAERMLEQVGRGLARFQQRVVPAEEMPATSEWLADVRDKVRELAAAVPSLAEPLGRLVDALNDGVPAEPFADALVHGDFHAKQLLWTGQALALFDFDDCGRGDPLVDLGMFITDLHRRDLSDADVRRLARALCRGYRRDAPWNLPAERLVWHTLVQMLIKAHWFYQKKQHRPDLESSLRHLLAQAAEIPGWLAKASRS
jgi:hypothetical protein